MKRRILRLAAVVALTLAALFPMLGAGPSKASATALEPTCDVRLDSPHWSTKGVTVVAKAYFTCTAPAHQKYVNVYLWLYACYTKPSGKPSQPNCGLRASNDAGTVDVAAGKEVPRYVPALDTVHVVDEDKYWVSRLRYAYASMPNTYFYKQMGRQGPLH